jgi:hypothetical protein
MLGELKALLLEGIKLSGQSSYQRRAPNAAALPLLTRVRDSVQQILLSDRENAEAWEILSRAQECLLNYAGAWNALEHSIRARGGNPGAKTLKRKALLEENRREWAELPIGPQELEELGNYLDKKTQAGHGGTLRCTREWLELRRLDVDRALSAFAERGGYTDLEILWNVC